MIFGLVASFLLFIAGWGGGGGGGVVAIFLTAENQNNNDLLGDGFESLVRILVECYTSLLDFGICLLCLLREQAAHE